MPKLLWGRSLVIGTDNRVSTSKTAALVWTYTLAAALASFVIAEWLGHPGGIGKLTHQGLDAKYALLIGGPIGAAILAKSIVSAQVASGEASKSEAESATPAQLVQNDSGQTDLGDVQYLLFNTVALLFFYGAFLRTPQGGLPTIPDVLVGLTSVAAAGYVGKKAISGPAAISEVAPSEARVGTTVKLATAGIVRSGDDLSLVKVTFGAAEAHVTGPITETATQGVLLEVAVPEKAAGKVEVTVSVPSGRTASWSTFKVKPEIEPDAPASAAIGAKFEVTTTGVSGLAPKLLGVTVKIADKPAEASVDPDDPSENKLVVTVPKGISIPEGSDRLITEIVVFVQGIASDPKPFTVLRA